tara:strand:- start:6666 stop:6857 length:192 start_codon:yes stop_codon:yes gene_type:complete
MKRVKKRIQGKARRLMTADIFSPPRRLHVIKMRSAKEGGVLLDNGSPRPRCEPWWTTPRTKDV